jgi:putative hydrolase
MGGFGFTGSPGEGEPFNINDLGALFSQMGRIFSHAGEGEGGISPGLVSEIALEAVKEDPAITDEERRSVDEALRLADLWLNDVTSFTSTSAITSAWSRKQWVKESVDVWTDVVAPIAKRVSDTMTQSMEAMGTDPSMQEMASSLGMGGLNFGAMGPMKAILDQMGGAIFAAQLGQALGKLAGEVVCSTDMGLPLASSGRQVLLPANVEKWGEGLGIDGDQIRLFLALRETAAVRLFSEVTWLRHHVTNAIHAYAQGITIDISIMQEQAERAMEEIADISDPAALQAALEKGMFGIEESPQQKAAVSRLETVLALIEGWIDLVVADAAKERLPAFGALQETARRRRAAGGPAEAIFATLVGLQLRPRRLRDAAGLWGLIEHERGVEGRDAVWAHPDTLPDASDLDDPHAFIERSNIDIPDDLSGL